MELLLLAFSVQAFLKGMMLVFFILLALLLMLVVLLQEPKGGGLSAAFGGAGQETFGVQAGGVNKFTAWLAFTWMLLAVIYAAWPEGEAPAASDIQAEKEMDWDGPDSKVGATSNEPAKNDSTGGSGDGTDGD